MDIYLAYGQTDGQTPTGQTDGQTDTYTNTHTPMHRYTDKDTHTQHTHYYAYAYMHLISWLGTFKVWSVTSKLSSHTLFIHTVNYSMAPDKQWTHAPLKYIQAHGTTFISQFAYGYCILSLEFVCISIGLVMTVHDKHEISACNLIVSISNSSAVAITVSHVEDRHKPHKHTYMCFKYSTKVC